MNRQHYLTHTHQIHYNIIIIVINGNKTLDENPGAPELLAIVTTRPRNV